MAEMTDKAKALINGVLRGLEAPADTLAVNRYSYPQASEQDAMRQDWYRVGHEIKDAMKRADAETAS
jgi:hypothetical protein